MSTIISLSLKAFHFVKTQVSVKTAGIDHSLPQFLSFTKKWKNSGERRHWQIRNHISCSSSNLIYMIQRSRCQVQYVGETKRQCSDRFGEHRRAIKKAITQRHIDQLTAVLFPGHVLHQRHRTHSSRTHSLEQGQHS